MREFPRSNGTWSFIDLVRRGVYFVVYGCTNCHSSSSIEFSRGEAAPDRIKCPKCGCFAAVKKW